MFRPLPEQQTRGNGQQDNKHLHDVATSPAGGFQQAAQQPLARAERIQLHGNASPADMVRQEVKEKEKDGRKEDWETGRLGDWETGRLGDWETGRLGDWVNG
ncbi:hypothetical protein ACUNV4_24145 [Granulosicoccus sp. 3-233]|uniref:hypothetical protein n=1 Tax=Granulosicoccus sp. 3-233 TaxID=3417969 RepID=UPI003D330127